MFKKFIIVFSFALIIFGFKEVKAATYTDPCLKAGFDTRYMDLYYFSTDAQNNTIQFSYQAQNDTQSRDYIKPVIVRKLNNGQSYYYAFICKSSTNCLKRVPSGSSSSEYTSSSLTSNIAGPYYELYNTPVFDDYEAASNYSRGLEFDSSHLLGGLVVPYEFDDSVKYSIDISNFDFNFKLPAANFSLYWEWTETPDVPQDCDRLFSFNISYLDKTTLETLYYAYGNDGLNWNTLISVYKTIQAGGVSGLIDYPNNMLSTYLTFDLDKSILGSAGDYIEYGGEQSVGSTLKHYCLWTEVTDPTTMENNINPYGIIAFLKDYYGDFKKAIFSLNYLSINFIDSYVIKYTSQSKKVYDWYNTYYIDLIKSNGTVYEHRSFKTRNSLTQNDIDSNNTPNNIGDIPEDLPVINIPNSERNNSYNQTIQDSYNNIVNNYYYDNGLTDNILNYYRGFSDGTTDESIDSALGYVKSTIGALTHIPLLLHYTFVAFFPQEILNLFYALLIIFVVFLIIRVIKHLFTH